MKMKILVDVLMTGCLLFLMPYELIGRMAHEWIGAGMFLLFVLHHILNRRWTVNLKNGKYTAVRILQTALVFLVLVSILGSMVSGILLSRYVFAFLDIKGAVSFARDLHMACAYWGFVWMSLHLGVHWNRMLGMAGKMLEKPSDKSYRTAAVRPAGTSITGGGLGIRKWIARAAALVIAGYGVHAFIKREIGSYMLVQIQFVFFDFEEPLAFFILDYIAAMGLFVFIGHYICVGLIKYHSLKRNL